MFKFIIRNRFLISAIALLITFTFVLAGCGSNNGSGSANNVNNADTAAKPVVIKVGASPKPHAEILEYIKPQLAKEGIDLQIILFNEYVQPNLATESGDIDANFFQHAPYLESFTKEHNISDLVSIAKVHIEPMGVYSKKVTNLDQLQNDTTITIPNDPSNSGRALALLEKAGLIKLKEGVGIKGTVQDITANSKQFKIVLIDAAQLPRTLNDVAASVINTNFALEGGLNPMKDALLIEDKDSPYANILVVKKDKENDPNIQKLVKALNSSDLKEFIQDQYAGSVVPAF